tara:strand:- start:21 stop:392 length:372 start_codon:yes stop_codon:yes gene_type:complete
MNDYEQYNPILQMCEEHEQLKSFDLELAYKIKNIDFCNWSCSICLDNVNNEMNICLPFNCDHAICFKCFSKMCKTIKNAYLRPKKIKCPLCRKLPSKDWIDKDKVTTKAYINKDFICNISIPY